MEQNKIALAAMIALGSAGALAQQFEFVGQRFEVYDATKRAAAPVQVVPLPAAGGGRVSTLPYASQSGQGSVALSPKAVATSGGAGCPAGMVQLPIAIPGACVDVKSPYVTSGRYQQDLTAAQTLPDQIRATAAPRQSQANVSPQGATFDAREQHAAPATPKPLAMLSSSTAVQSDGIAPVPASPNVETRAFDGGTYSFLRQPQTSNNPIYKVGDVQLGGDDALIQNVDAKWHEWKPGLDLGDVRVAVEGNGVKGTCSYDLSAYGDAVPGTLVNVSGTCTTDDGRTFRSTGEAYRNYQGGDSNWNINAGIGSTEPGNPFASVKLRASVEKDGAVNGGVFEGDRNNPMRAPVQVASVAGKADASDPVGFNGSTDLKEITLSNGDKCTIGVNPWSMDTNAVVGECATASGSLYRLEGMAVNNVRSTNLTEYMVEGFRDGQRVYLSGDVAPGGNLSNLTTVGASVAQYRDIPDTQNAPAPAVVQQSSAASVVQQGEPSPVLTQVAASVSQPVQTVGSSVNGPTSCGPDEELRGSGWWDDPYVCVSKTPARSDDWGGNA